MDTVMLPVMELQKVQDPADLEYCVDALVTVVRKHNK